ncbi:MAG: flagellar basal-body MS-ring/collar protein FliF [Geminicoccaceae bacterium]
MEQKGIIAAGAEGRKAGTDAAGRGWPGLALVKALGPGRILALGAVALLLLGFFAYIISRATEPSYTLLFSGLDLRDAQALSQRLEGLGVPYRLSGDGGAIMVPAKDALRLRMSLAEEGMPVGAPVGYELFDRASPFTTSDFLANVNLRRAVEGELARSIGTLRQVRSARVHLVEPKRSLFGREEVKPTASIVLALRQPGTLDREQVAGIRHLVAAAVPGLEPNEVTIVDDRGDLLAEPSGVAGAALALGETETQRVAFESRLRDKIVQLLERTLGPGRVDAAVSADLDFDEVATTAESYDPSSQVVRSTRTTDETSDASDSRPGEPVSVANNLPSEKAPPAANGGTASSDRKNRSEETVNYEISRTVRNQTKRGSTVRRLSIAVQVDGSYHERPDGGRDFEPRPAEELAQIRDIVRSAAGADESRGDKIEVVSRPFVAPEATEPPPAAGWLGLSPDGYQRLIELGVLALLTLVVLFFGVRPLLARLLPAAAGAAPAAETEAAAHLIIGEDAAADQGAAARLAAVKPAAASALAGPAASTDLLGEVAQAVDAAPQDAVRIMRAWLQGG